MTKFTKSYALLAATAAALAASEARIIGGHDHEKEDLYGNILSNYTNSRKYPPQAVTLWWVFANNPTACVSADVAAALAVDREATTNHETVVHGPRCGPLDVFGSAFLESLTSDSGPDPLLISTNPDAQIGIVYATGGVTDEHGNIRLVASNYASSTNSAMDIDPSIDPLALRTGLINATTAEVGVVVKTHGDDVGDIAQITELFDPYCDDPIIGWEGPKNDAGRLCVEVQNVLFQSGKAGTLPLNHIYTEPPQATENGQVTLIRRGDAVQVVVDANIFDVNAEN